MSKKRVVIYDLDGVIVDSRVRSAKYIDKDAENRGDAEALHQSLVRWGGTTEGDVLIREGLVLVEGLLDAAEADTAYALTSRFVHGRELTEAWLRQNTMLLDIPHAKVLMRPMECRDDSVTYKRDVITALMQDHEVLYCVDDHAFICDMYRELGLPTIHFQLRDANCLWAAGPVQPLHTQVINSNNAIFDELNGHKVGDDCLVGTVVDGCLTWAAASTMPYAITRLSDVMRERGMISDGVFYALGPIDTTWCAAFNSQVLEIRHRDSDCRPYATN